VLLLVVIVKFWVFLNQSSGRLGRSSPEMTCNLSCRTFKPCSYLDSVLLLTAFVFKVIFNSATLLVCKVFVGIVHPYFPSAKL